MGDQRSAVDTSVLVAAHVAGHEHHQLAAPAAAGSTHVLGPVLAEAWSVMRRHFRIPAVDVARVLRAYVDARRLVAPSEEDYDEILSRGPGLDLAGNVHDYVIVRTAAGHGLRVLTLDRGMARLAHGDVVHVGPAT